MKALGKALGKAFGLAPFLFALATPAHAEKLMFDHRLYPPLKAVLDRGEEGMVLFDASNPRYIIDRIAVSGKSAKRWTEALEIIARTPTKGMTTAADWMAELRAKANPKCAYDAKIIAQDDISITFERRMTDCPDERAPIAIYRIVAGKQSLFLLAVLEKAEPDAEVRKQWLALLASSRLE